MGRSWGQTAFFASEDFVPNKRPLAFIGVYQGLTRTAAKERNHALGITAPFGHGSASS
jgi:hypothetical protein